LGALLASNGRSALKRRVNSAAKPFDQQFDEDANLPRRMPRMLQKHSAFPLEPFIEVSRPVSNRSAQL